MYRIIEMSPNEFVIQFKARRFYIFYKWTVVTHTASGYEDRPVVYTSVEGAEHDVVKVRARRLNERLYKQRMKLYPMVVKYL